MGNGDTTSNSHVGRHSLKEIVAGQTLSDLDLLVELGKGAFAKVFSAYQATMHRVVAVLNVGRSEKIEQLEQIARRNNWPKLAEVV